VDEPAYGVELAYVEAGARLFETGALSGAMYVVLRGSRAVERDGVRLRTVGRARSSARWVSSRVTRAARARSRSRRPNSSGSTARHSHASKRRAPLLADLQRRFVRLRAERLRSANAETNRAARVRHGPRGRATNQPEMPSSSRRIVLIVTCAFAVGIALVAALVLRRSHATAPVAAAVGAQPAPPLRLTDQRGLPFSLASLRGTPVVVFFGYSHCPDACPLALAHLARAIHARPALGVRVVLVTVDPARDTPAVLAAYARRFDPAFVALTGSRARIAAVARAYHVYVAPRPGASGTIEHGAPLFLIGRDGTIRAYEDASATPRELEASFAHYFA